ncbi:MAG: response regulator [Krumholzibacteria bacterium]|nr:response regulator [Candidatus Krumholzibacteria bacterium]
MERNLRILVVDDEPDILETLEFSLTRRGFTVATAVDGLEGLEKAKRNPPDVMILDVMLPGCNGYEVSRMLKEWMENDPQATLFPILLLTARKVDTRDREKFVATWSRADACLYKPFEMDEVVATLARLAQVNPVRA